jgi:hypothetical protein
VSKDGERFFCGTEILTKGFFLARSVLYLLHGASALFAVIILDKVSLFAQVGLDSNPPILHFPL